MLSRTKNTQWRRGERRGFSICLVRTKQTDLSAKRVCKPPNVIFDGKCAKLIDFDWGGRFNHQQAKRNLQGVPLLVQEKIMSPTLSDLANTEFARFPINICKDLFQEEALAPILPSHDWKMWRMLYGLTSDQGDAILRQQE